MIQTIAIALRNKYLAEWAYQSYLALEFFSMREYCVIGLVLRGFRLDQLFLSRKFSILACNHFPNLLHICPMMHDLISVYSGAHWPRYNYVPTLHTCYEPTPHYICCDISCKLTPAQPLITQLCFSNFYCVSTEAC
jgi:hypothetical protein